MPARAQGEGMSDTTSSLRRKISSAGDLQSVVRTMKAQAASSIGQYDNSVHALGEYYRTVELGLGACFRESERFSARADRFLGFLVIPFLHSCLIPIFRCVRRIGKKRSRRARRSRGNILREMGRRARRYERRQCQGGCKWDQSGNALRCHANG